MNNEHITLTELRAFGESLAIPGLYSKRNQDKAHLARYIDWWIRLTQMEQGIDQPEEPSDSSTPAASPDSSSMLNPTPASHSKAFNYLDNIGVPVEPTPHLYVQTVNWGDWTFAEGYTEEETDPFHHIDITHKPTKRTWMVSVIEHGANFAEATDKLTRIINLLTKDKPTLTGGRSPPLKTYT